MDSHPKKKKKYRANQKSNHGHVVGRDQYNLYSIQSKSKPNPITQHCNTEVFIKKKRNQIQSKKETKYRANQTPDLEQTKPTVARSSLHDLRHSSSSSSRRHSLASRRRSSLARRRRSQIGLTVSTAPVLGLKVFLSLFLSDSLSLSHSLTH